MRKVLKAPTLARLDGLTVVLIIKHAMTQPQDP